MKTNNKMDTSEKIKLASQILGGGQSVKRLNNDKSLIERTMSSTIILTEDNRELLKD